MKIITMYYNTIQMIPLDHFQKGVAIGRPVGSSSRIYIIGMMSNLFIQPASSVVFWRNQNLSKQDQQIYFGPRKFTFWENAL